MSKVITFSTKFRKGHLKQGEDTYFVIGILNVLGIRYNYNDWSYMELLEKLNPNIDALLLYDFWDSIKYIYRSDKKYHTIRKTSRFIKRDYFSPRIWSGKPYASKQIQFAPDIEIKNLFHFSMKITSVSAAIIQKFMIDGKETDAAIIAKNDCLDLASFLTWFNHDFEGEIICWDENIKY